MEAMSLACLEEDIAKQKLALSFLYTRKNSFSFVCRLPTEILADIFICYARDSYRYPDYRDTIPPRWIGVSYVCRHWRNIALESSTLWSHIPLLPQRWIEELLARSKKAPLKICIGVPSNIGGFSDTLEKVINNVERIQELKMDILGRHAVEWVLSKFTMRAPLLQNLTICAQTGSSVVSTLPLLFNGDTPVLRTLKLSQCPAPWYLLRPSRLTTLILHGVPAQFQQNIEVFLTALSCMKDISHLHVERLPSSQGFISSASFNTFERINLPRLSRLLIVCPVSTAVAFIAYVDIPTRAEVRLGCSPEDDASLGNCALLSSVLAQRFYAFAGPMQTNLAIRSLIIEPWLTPTLTFSALERDQESFFSGHYISVSDPYTTNYTGWGHNIPLQIRWCERGTSAERIISDICCSIPLTHIQSIHVIKPPSSLGFWEHILGHAQDLRYLKLSQGGMPGLASLLSLPSHDITENMTRHADAGSSPMLVPVLEELTLSDITFGPTPGLEDTLEGATDLPSLAAALSTRKDPAVRLDVLECCEYYSDEEY